MRRRDRSFAPIDLLMGRQKLDRGLSRRRFLSLSLGGLAAADILRLQAVADQPAPRRSVIIVCLPGGPSHIDLYDLKPEAPVEIRGEFRPIATKVPGTFISELLPLHAQIADRFSIIRSMTYRWTPPTDHDAHECYSGFPPKAGRPAFGSLVSHLRGGSNRAIPAYVALLGHGRQDVEPEAPLYAGLAHGPFEPSGKELNDLQLQRDLDVQRLRSRVSLAQQLDRFPYDLDQRGTMPGMDEFTRRAVDMIATPAVRAALDISREPEHVRWKYGPDLPPSPGLFGRNDWRPSKLLIARRLVEAGVPVVTLGVGSWDHHGVLSNGPRAGIFERMREEAPRLDQALHALVTDLDERGLSERVSVVVWGEMGRTPRINRQAGRDHWADAGFALVAGGAFKAGQVVGATNSRAEVPTTRRLGPQNVFAMLYRFLGIDPATTVPDYHGRPQYLLDDREPIEELVV